MTRVLRDKPKIKRTEREAFLRKEISRLEGRLDAAGEHVEFTGQAYARLQKENEQMKIAIVKLEMQISTRDRVIAHMSRALAQLASLQVITDD